MNQLNTQSSAHIHAGQSASAALAAQDRFTQTDWEFQLDLLVRPSTEELQAHMNKLPAAEAGSETAIFLQQQLDTARGMLS